MMTDQEYLRRRQYATSANLDARIALHVLFSANPYGWFPWLFDQIRLPGAARVLELGCGQGDFWRVNANRIPGGWQIFLSDLSSGMVYQTRQNLPEKLPIVGYAVIDAQSIPFPARSFEAMFANHMLYHLPDRGRALGEIRRVLKPGGLLVAATVGENHLSEIAGLEKEFAPQLAGQFMEWQIGFSLERGAAELQTCFERVELRRYVDGLLVGQAAPLADYILSSARMTAVRGQRPALVEFLEHKIAQNGGILRITKDSGVFIAWKPQE